MFITPINNRIIPLEAMETKFPAAGDSKSESIDGNPTFLDVFTGIFNSAAETGAQKTQDMLDLMLGDVDNLEEIQLNIEKAQIATDLLVTVKNSVVDAYNEIIKMSI